MCAECLRMFDALLRVRFDMLKVCNVLRARFDVLKV